MAPIRPVAGLAEAEVVLAHSVEAQTVAVVERMEEDLVAVESLGAAVAAEAADRLGLGVDAAVAVQESHSPPKARPGVMDPTEVGLTAVELVVVAAEECVVEVSAAVCSLVLPVCC